MPIEEIDNSFEGDRTLAEMAKAKVYPHYELEKDEYSSGRRVVVEQLTENGYANKIALLDRYDEPFSSKTKTKAASGTYPYWSLRGIAGSEPESMAFAGRVVFPSEEQAFAFVKTLRALYHAEVARRPLPAEVNDLIHRLARDLSDRKQRASSELMSLYYECRAMESLAKKFGIREAVMWVDNSDAAKAVRSLNEFKVPIEDEDDLEEGEVGKNDDSPFIEAPFFSEACLYNLIGKEDARTVLSMWNHLVSLIAPTEAH